MKEIITSSIRVEEDLWTEFKSIVSGKRLFLSEVLEELIQEYNKKNKEGK